MSQVVNGTFRWHGFDSGFRFRNFVSVNNSESYGEVPRRSLGGSGLMHNDYILESDAFWGRFYPGDRSILLSLPRQAGSLRYFPRK